MPRDLHALFDIVRSAELVVRYTDGVSEEAFAVDEQLQDAVIRRLSVIGEAAGRISELGRGELSTIDWPKIRGLRNRLVHEYDNISLRIVWAISQNEMADLVSKIKPMLPTEEQLSIPEE
ncbi:DUF86 domain-containing protein [cf. Phormidesmis sp. LEGE 11477]|nr:DUF86 domain-containing protein [cf. Phormidesmis sp. LEGE 11477]